MGFLGACGVLCCASIVCSGCCQRFVSQDEPISYCYSINIQNFSSSFEVLFVDVVPLFIFFIPQIWITQQMCSKYGQPSLLFPLLGVHRTTVYFLTQHSCGASAEVSVMWKCLLKSFKLSPLHHVSSQQYVFRDVHLHYKGHSCCLVK